jgi:hypothetical protein
MNIQTKKYQLIHQILQVNDEQLIDTVKHLLDFGLKHEIETKDSTEDFWDKMTKSQKKRIELSLLQMEEGVGIAHEEVMSEFKAKFK